MDKYLRIASVCSALRYTFEYFVKVQCMFDSQVVIV